MTVNQYKVIMEKLANTLENKAKFLLHCYAENKDSIKSYQGSGVVFGILDIINNPENYYAELTPLSQITDEDAIEVAKMENAFENPIKRGKIIVNDMFIEQYPDDWYPHLVFEVYQYLQSKGYALPWMGLLVDDLISYGWVKLKEV